MQAMVDVAKIADLALLLIDASIGFEMETFEFLCLLHNHGMPNVMGILTHLDALHHSSKDQIAVVENTTLLPCSR